jgi:hypothetical protein
MCDELIALALSVRMCCTVQISDALARMEILHYIAQALKFWFDLMKLKYLMLNLAIFFNFVFKMLRKRKN